jgi:hypothetical protein
MKIEDLNGKKLELSAFALSGLWIHSFAFNKGRCPLLLPSPILGENKG